MSFIQILPYGWQGLKELNRLLLLSQCVSGELSWKREQLGLKLMLIWGVGAAGSSLACCAVVLAWLSFS